MAQALFLVLKTLEPGQEYVDGITGVLINLVSTSTDAQAKTAAVLAANASEKYAASVGAGVGNKEIGGTAPVIPASFKYFDTVVPCGAGPGSANLFTNKDAYVFKGGPSNGGTEFVPGASY